MTSQAEQRILELLDRWLTSLDLHIRYSSLDDDSYWKVQPWVEHQRPARWILDLAREKTAALKAQAEQRFAAGDGRFAEALEQMLFLANLVGLQHIERFIPVAEPGKESGEAATTGTREMPAPAAATGATREMPRLQVPPRPAAPPPPAALVARAERKAARTAHPRPADSGARKQVIADAQRLLQWGRRWYELAELIARMADRPPLAEVRRILDENRARIEKPTPD